MAGRVKGILEHPDFREVPLEGEVERRGESERKVQPGVPLPRVKGPAMEEWRAGAIVRSGIVGDRVPRGTSLRDG